MNHFQHRYKNGVCKRCGKAEDDVIVKSCVQYLTFLDPITKPELIFVFVIPLALSMVLFAFYLWWL